MTEDEWLHSDDVRGMLRWLGPLRQRVTPRKLRLFACACVRRAAPILVDPLSGEGSPLRALDAAEAFAEGSGDEYGMRKALRAVRATSQRVRGALDAAYAERNQATEVRAAASARAAEARLYGLEAAHMAYIALERLLSAGLSLSGAGAIAVRVLWAVTQEARGNWCRSRPRVPQERWVNDAAAAERRAQSNLVRDVFGFLLHPAVIPAAWRRRHDGLVARLAEAIDEERAFDRLPILGDALEDAGCTYAEMLGHCRNGGEHVRGCWVVDLLLGKGEPA
jgi:hypothetical protein